jgi:cytochrome c biogenesis protein CcdA/thiol-disulfide isomerase/thioredoxin
VALLLVFAFLSGLVTILAPCIWPVLPIVLSSSIAGHSHRRPLGITLGIVISFAFFTLTVSALVKIFHLDLNILRIIAVIVIAFMGLAMIFPALYTRFEKLITKFGNLFGGKANYEDNDFLPGFITGLSLGIVWTPCAGPVLAAIAALAATGKVSLDVILVTISYVVGVGIPLFAFAYGGQKFIVRLKGLSRYTGKIQQVFGVIMVLVAVAIYTNYDQTLQLKLINTFPLLGNAVNGFENSSAVTNQLNVLKGQTPVPTNETTGLFNTNIPAPDFVGITTWLNTDKPISIKDLKGKVVLVDFWTYTCINCIRTLPFITSWYNKYKDQGFVVIGVHTPEFQFEHDSTNVENAIKMYKILYPVAQDNNYATWNAYANNYWPAEYLIDAEGNIRRTHFGEGEYDQSELAIQELLKEVGEKVNMPLSNITDQTPKGNISPETYLGSTRMQYYFPNGNVGNGDQTFILADSPAQDSFSLGGEWNITNDTAITGKNAVLNYNFTANKVFLVLRPGTAGKQAKIKVFLDGKPVGGTNGGSDVINEMITVSSDRLYNLIDLKGVSGNHILRLEFEAPGIQAFAFTFG